MNNMIQFFDYIFYRTYVAYKKKDDPAKFNSIIYLSICFIALLSPLYTFFTTIVGPEHKALTDTVYILFLVIIIAAVTHRYYKDDFISRLYYRYEDGWGEKNIPTFFVFLTMPICAAVGFWCCCTIARFCDNHDLTGIGFGSLMTIVWQHLAP